MRILLIFCFLLFYGNPIFSADYNILDFGAVPDGKTLNTKVIQSAIDLAAKEGGGRILIPKGIFLTGTLNIKSGINIHLDKGATLLGSTKIEDYYKLNRWKALIIADQEKNISLSGEGIIDGQGRELALHIDSLYYAGEIDSLQYNHIEMRPKYYLRPQLIEFVECSYITVRNITLRDAACWVQTYDKSDHIVIDSIRVESDAYWNNDGIDIQDCRNVTLTNSYFNSSDDGICLKSQSSDYYCDSIFISDCVVRSSASAIKFGTVSHGGFRNVKINNIRIFDTYRSAIAIECVDGAVLEDIEIENIKATNTGNAIFIRLGERSKKQNMGILKNILIKNIKVEVSFRRPDYEYEIRGPALPFFHNTFPSSITGIPGYPVQNVTLENIEIKYPGKGNRGLANVPLQRLGLIPENISDYPEFSMFGELPAWGLYCRHIDGLVLKNIKFEIEDEDYRPAVVFDNVKNLTWDNFEIAGDEKKNKFILYRSKVVKVDSTEGILEIE